MRSLQALTCDLQTLCASSLPVPLRARCSLAMKWFSRLFRGLRPVGWKCHVCGRSAGDVTRRQFNRVHGIAKCTEDDPTRAEDFSEGEGEPEQMVDEYGEEESLRPLQRR